MIQYIKKHFGIGDYLFLLGNGCRISGFLEYVDDNVVVVKTISGDLEGISAESILSFSTQQRCKRPQPYGNNSVSAFQNPKVGTAFNEIKASLKPSGFQRVSLSMGEDAASNYPHANHPFFGSRGIITSDKQPSSAPYHVNLGGRLFQHEEKTAFSELVNREPQSSPYRNKKEEAKTIAQRLKEEIQKVMAEIHSSNRAEDLNPLPSMGAIVAIQPGYQFGFIDNEEEGKRYFFNRSDIIDPELKNCTGEHIEVIFQKGVNDKGSVAKCVQLPCSVLHSLEIAADLATQEVSSRAVGVINKVLEVYPDNQSAMALKEILVPLAHMSDGAFFQSPYFEHYKEGKRLLAEYDFSGAIIAFQTALENGVKPIACIKSILQCYISLHAKTSNPIEREKVRAEGLNFIEKHKDQLPYNSSILFTLENAYFALGNYIEHIEVAEEIISQAGQNRDLPQYVFYLNKVAQSYLRLGELDKALEAVTAGLSAEPEHKQLIQTHYSVLDAIKTQGADSRQR